MSKIRFITDSASDIPAADERELGLQILAFPVSFGENTYMSRGELSNDEFFALLEQSPAIPTTSQITVFRYGEAYEAAFNEGCSDVINVTINAESSGTYNSACLAAQMFFETHPEAEGSFHIHVLDGRSYASAYGYAVIEGAKMARDGASVENILAFMNDWIEHAVIYFVPYTLKYAAKSGRIPSAAAFVGELVGLKPIMRIYDHNIVTNDKVRGEKKVIHTLTSKTKADIADESPYIVLYGNCPENADALAKALTDTLGYPPIAIHQIGVAIAANCGPHAVGVVFHEK